MNKPEDALQSKANTIEQEINKEKMRIMKNLSCKRRKYIWNRTAIEEVEHFVHLGSY